MIDVIIPARNEAGTIGTIVETFYNHPIIRRIIVVCDSCTDDTHLYASFHGASIVITDDFGGKGQAVLAGLERVETTFVMFCDGDLTGLTGKHITRLASEALAGRDSLTIGIPEIPDNYPTGRIWAWPWVSGQRCVPTRLVKPLRLHGYLMEVQINAAAGHAQMPVHHVWLPGLRSTFNFTDERIAEMQRDARWGKEHGIL